MIRIEKINKYVLVFALLFSVFSWADWGDTYFCSMNKYLSIDTNGELSELSLKNFKFQVSKEKNAIVFSKVVFPTQDDQLEFKIKGNNFNHPLDLWRAEIGNVHQATFLNGNFIYTLNTLGAITIAVAKCDSFD